MEPTLGAFRFIELLLLMMLSQPTNHMPIENKTETVRDTSIFYFSLKRQQLFYLLYDSVLAERIRLHFNVEVSKIENTNAIDK